MTTSIEDLPRLTDEERDALGDEYVAIEGIPRVTPPRRVRFPRLASLAIAIITALGLTACIARDSRASIFFLGILAGWALVALAAVAIYWAFRALSRTDDRENAAEDLRRHVDQLRKLQNADRRAVLRITQALSRLGP